MSGAPAEGGAIASVADEVIDHHSEDFARRQRDIYRAARAGCPVLHTGSHGGFSILTRYADIRAALRDSAAFSSARFVDEDGQLAGGVAIPPNGMRIGMIEMDPPEATRLRELLNPWFAIAAIEAGSERIGQAVRWIVDSVIERGECDVVRDLAQPLPSILILDLLGLPLANWQRYGQILHAAVAKTSGSLEGLRWLFGDVRAAITNGSYEPGGLVGYLAHAEIDGERLGLDMVSELTMMLLFGGTDTTIASIGHAIRHLGRNEADRQALIDDPGKLDRFVEELIRFYSPSTGVARTVTAPVEIGGARFAPGDRVLCAVNSGNLDEATFADAETFDMDRPKRPHLGFGWGVHACLGQNLARTELRLFLAELLARMPDFAIDEAGTEPYASTPLVNGYAAMPIRFTPGKRRDVGPSAYPPFSAKPIRPI